ncbi:hypothetical protein Hanom_Chr13g01241311 [Helianthus anomalus]
MKPKFENYYVPTCDDHMRNNIMHYVLQNSTPQFSHRILRYYSLSLFTFLFSYILYPFQFSCTCHPGNESETMYINTKYKIQY